MALRLMGCALLLMMLAAFKVPASPARADAEQPAPPPSWEYKVITLDGLRCAQDQAMTKTLNASGQEGWELMSYERPAPPPFPEEAEGTLLIKPAATGPGRMNNPQTVDSFTGTMELKMGQAISRNRSRTRPQIQSQDQPPCRMLFKRQLKSAAKP